MDQEKSVKLVDIFTSVYIYYGNINQSSESYFLNSGFCFYCYVNQASVFTYVVNQASVFYAYVNQERHIFVIPFYVSLHYYDQINRYVFT